MSNLYVLLQDKPYMDHRLVGIIKGGSQLNIRLCVALLVMC